MLAAVLALALCFAPPPVLAQAAGAARQSTTPKSPAKGTKPPAKGKRKSKPKGKSKPGNKTKKGKGKKKPAGGGKKPAGGKKKEKKGGAPTYALSAQPNQVGPVPPMGCAALTVKAFYEVPTGPKKTREFPYHPGASTQKVDLTTTLGVLNPAKTTLGPSGTAKSSICSALPGVAVVTVTIPSFEPTQFAKQCKQTKTTLCKRSKPRVPVTATVTFVGKNGEPGEKKPGEVPGGAPGSSSDLPPVAAFGFSPNNAPTAPKAGDTVSFDGSGSHDPDGTIAGWSWLFGAPLYGGGGFANTVSGGSGPTPSTSFSAPGVYPVTLTVTDNAALTGSVTHNVYVSGPGTKPGEFATEPTDALGCSGTIAAWVEIYIPTYAQNQKYAIGTPTGGCIAANITNVKVTRTSKTAPPDNEGKPRLDAWGEVRDTYRIEFTIEGGAASQGTIPFTASWS